MTSDKKTVKYILRIDATAIKKYIIVFVNLMYIKTISNRLRSSLKQIAKSFNCCFNSSNWYSFKYTIESLRRIDLNRNDETCSRIRLNYDLKKQNDFIKSLASLKFSAFWLVLNSISFLTYWTAVECTLRDIHRKFETFKHSIHLFIIDLWQRAQMSDVRFDSLFVI